MHVSVRVPVHVCVCVRVLSDRKSTQIMPRVR